MGNIVLGYKRFICRIVEDNRTLAVCVIDPLFKLFLFNGHTRGIVGEAEIYNIYVLRRNVRQEVVFGGAGHIVNI